MEDDIIYALGGADHLGMFSQSKQKINGFFFSEGGEMSQERGILERSFSQDTQDYDTTAAALISFTPIRIWKDPKRE